VKRKISSSLFGLVLICFFLPFMTVSCQSRKISSFTGVQLVTGISINSGDSFYGQSTTRQVRGEPLAFFAVAFAIVGLGIGLSNWKKNSKWSMGSAIAGLVFMLLLKSKIDNDVLTQAQGMVQVDYDIGFWGSILLFFAAAVVNFLSFQGDEN
jgi:hypothetical protein